MKNLSGKALVGAGSVMLALLAVEAFLRIRQPVFHEVIAALNASRESARDSLFVLDDEMGYRPMTGGSSPYSVHGISDEELAPDPNLPKKKRILFVGDSVVAQGRIQQALARYGDYELLNAGVHGFNVPQEVAFYDRYNSQVSFDAVVIVIHNNDLYYLPMVYRASSGPVFLYVYGEPPLLVSSWWLERSYLYRFYVHLRMQRIVRRASAANQLPVKTAEALEHLKNELRARRIAFKALVFPVLKNQVSWSPEELRSRETALEILRRLGIDHEDLWPILRDEIVQHGPDSVAATPGDLWHPNDHAAERIAEHLKRVDFLERKSDP